jgi:hypothetical protein
VLLRKPSFKGHFSFSKSYLGKDVKFDYNIELLLVGRCQLRWEEGVGDWGSRILGSCPTVSVPEKRVPDDEFPVENVSA